MKYLNSKSVEHRYSERVPLRQDVWIMHGDRKLGPYRTRNVCRDGIFIEHHDAELYPNDMLRVALCADKNGSSQEPIDVIVTHRNSDGIGVLASKYHVDLQDSLQTANVNGTGSKSCPSDNQQYYEQVLARITHKINPLDQAEILVSKNGRSSRLTVTVRAAGVLDLTAIDLMRNACLYARRYKAAGVIVDLAGTHRIQDSGLAMLMLLKQNLGQQVGKIKLVNTAHLSNRQLDELPI